MKGRSMKGTVVIAATAIGALALAACGSSGGGGGSASGGGGSSTKSCAASIGMEGPLTGPVAVLGQEQLHFAQLAVSADNAANKTKISIVQGDTQLNPAQATTVTQQLTSNSKVIAVVGPAGSQEVEAVGPLMTRAGMPFVAESATAASLTTGKYPTFFRVVSKDSVQGPQDAKYIIDNLHPKSLMIIDDQESYSTGLVDAMTPVFKAAGIKVDHESVPQKQTQFGSLVPKVTSAMSVVVLPWQVAANAQEFGRELAQQHKKAVIFGTDGLFSPGTFTINGSYVSSFGPDITAIPADKAIADEAKAKFGKFGTFGPPVYAATHVIDEAIASVCKAGQTPSRSNVLDAIKKTDEPTSILGQPIKFDSHGDLVNGKFFLFKIDASGKYNLIPN
jgi:branched-chain amino acid transport system substrate-binding protein